MSNLPQPPSPDDEQARSTPNELEDQAIMPSPAGDYPRLVNSYPSRNKAIPRQKPSKETRTPHSRLHLLRRQPLIRNPLIFHHLPPPKKAVAYTMILDRVGPLPSDLWDLIGQTPPEQPVTRMPPEATYSVDNIPTVVQETPYPASQEPGSKAAVEVADQHDLVEPPPRQLNREDLSIFDPTPYQWSASARILCRSIGPGSNAGNR